MTSDIASEHVGCCFWKSRWAADTARCGRSILKGNTGKCGSGFGVERESKLFCDVIISYSQLALSVLFLYRTGSQRSPCTAEGREVSLGIALNSSNFLPSPIGINDARNNTAFDC